MRETFNVYAGQQLMITGGAECSHDLSCSAVPAIAITPSSPSECYQSPGEPVKPLYTLAAQPTLTSMLPRVLAVHFENIGTLRSEVQSLLHSL